MSVDPKEVEKVAEEMRVHATNGGRVVDLQSLPQFAGPQRILEWANRLSPQPEKKRARLYANSDWEQAVIYDGEMSVYLDRIGPQVEVHVCPAADWEALREAVENYRRDLPKWPHTDELLACFARADGGE